MQQALVYAPVNETSTFPLDLLTKSPSNRYFKKCFFHTMTSVLTVGVLGRGRTFSVFGHPTRVLAPKQGTWLPQVLDILHRVTDRTLAHSSVSLGSEVPAMAPEQYLRWTWRSTVSAGMCCDFCFSTSSSQFFMVTQILIRGRTRNLGAKRIGSTGFRWGLCDCCRIINRDRSLLAFIVIVS